MSQKWTTEMYRNYVEEHCGDEFLVLGEYTNNNTPVLMYHKICGREFTCRPGNFKQRKTCSLCNGKFKKTTEQFKEEVFDKTGDEFEVVGKYVNAKAKVKIKHNQCGRFFYITPDDFLNQGNRCSHCNRRTAYAPEEFREIVKSLVGEEYTVNGEYVNKRTPISFTHNTCGKTFLKAPELFVIAGNRCPDCGLKRRSGSNHYRYNNKLTEADRMKRDMFNGSLKKWRAEIYNRDNFTCVKCGEKGGKLNAHHLNSWDTHENERFSLENGVTLCESCHKKFHTQYGYGNNNKQQFEKYLAAL